MDEQRLRIVDTRAIAILENMTEAFITLDTEWRFVYMNLSAEQFLRRSRQELLGKNIWDEFPMMVDSVMYEQYHTVITTRTPARFETFYPTLKIWAEVHAYPTDGGLMAYFHDITDKKRVVRELEDSEQRFRAVWETSGDAMALSDSEGIVIAANPAYYRLYGYTPEEVVGHSYAIIFPEKERKEAIRVQPGPLIIGQRVIAHPQRE